MCSHDVASGTSPYGPDSRVVVLTITVWVASLVFGLPMPQSRDTCPGHFPTSVPGERISHHRGAKAFVLFVLPRRWPYCCCRSPRKHLSPEEPAGACHDRVGGHDGRTSDRPARHVFPAPSFFAAYCCLLLPSASPFQTLWSHPGRKSMHFICRKAKNRFRALRRRIHLPRTVRCAARASCRHRLALTLPLTQTSSANRHFPSNPISLSCFSKRRTPRLPERRLVAVVPVDRSEPPS